MSTCSSSPARMPVVDSKPALARPARSWSAALPSILAAGLLVSSLAIAGCCKESAPEPGQKEFETANAQIDTFDKEVGFGNTPEAKTLAARYAAELEKREKEAFEGGKDAEESATTQGKWLTHCQLREDRVVFLVHVPNLDTYEGDVRKALLDMAWETGTELTKKARSTKDKTVVVALRGNLLFGAMASGLGNAKPQLETDTSIDAAKLYPHFVN